MADEIIVPAAIEQIIQKYEAAKSPFTELEVQQEVGKGLGRQPEPRFV
jgi:hypothetical protein